MGQPHWTEMGTGETSGETSEIFRTGLKIYKVPLNKVAGHHLTVCKPLWMHVRSLFSPFLNAFYLEIFLNTLKNTNPKDSHLSFD
jgi:hypothetical protein